VDAGNAAQIKNQLKEELDRAEAEGPPAVPAAPPEVPKP
jgi:hypothetical protein